MTPRQALAFTPIKPKATQKPVLYWYALALVTWLLLACSSATTPPTTQVTPPTVATSAPPSSPNLQPGIQGILRPPPLNAPAVPEPNHYANHPQVPILAQQLAQSYLLDANWVLSVLSQARFNASVSRLIMPAANPGAKNWAVYRSRFVEPIRIRKGRLFWNTHQMTLQKAAKQFGVPANIIAGIIGVETIYGEQTGQFRVLDALSTLSLNFPLGRKDRSAFFTNQLGEFLRLCAEQEIDPRDVLGSYAGAMGWPQFMPSSIRHYAIDFDGDGHINLHQSVPDVIGSVANFLTKHGWQAGVPTHFRVQVPADPPSLAHLLAPDILPSFKPAEMQAYGAALDTPGQRHTGLLALVKLENAENSPSYVAGTENFYAITQYNHSSYYALAVIELAEAISGGDLFSVEK